MSHPAASTAEELLKVCEVIRQRRSGPGGQHRNKVETAIRLTHRPTGVTAEASERRSQADNLKIALRRLRMSLAIDVRETPEDGPSRVWRSRTSGGTISLNRDHVDVPTMLAEALDMLHSEGWDTVAAVERLSCSTSQLVKLLKLDVRALQQLNDARFQQGLRPLR